MLHSAGVGDPSSPAGWYSGLKQAIAHNVRYLDELGSRHWWASIDGGEECEWLDDADYDQL
jgi:hypothetical protein